MDDKTVTSATPPLVLSRGNLALAYDDPFSVAPTAPTTAVAGALSFWMVVHVNAMAVDNAGVIGMDYSTLPSNVEIVEWKNGLGQIEYNDRPRLRENFIDITPYCSLFQQYMNLVIGITLDQAKKIQIDLIAALFDSKRQAPYHHPVAAGDYYWDASDATMFPSTIPAIQDLISKLNQLIGQLNPAIPALNSAGQSTVSQVNNTVVVGGNTLSNAVNINVVTQVNALVNEINSHAIAPEISIYTEFNNNIANPQAGNVARLSADLQASGQSAGPDLITCAAPGLDGNLTAFASLSGSCSASYLSTNAYSVGNYFSDITDTWTISWTPVANAAGSNQSWVPVGSTTPVNVTPAEQAAIMQGIASRTTNLTTTKNTKTNEVNVLTTISAVIAYDVTAGWPAV